MKPGVVFLASLAILLIFPQYAFSESSDNTLSDVKSSTDSTTAPNPAPPTTAPNPAPPIPTTNPTPTKPAPSNPAPSNPTPSKTVIPTSNNDHIVMGLRNAGNTISTGNGFVNPTGKTTPSNDKTQPNAPVIDSTAVSISTSNVITKNSQVTFTATVIDITNSASTPTGTVSWSDKGAGGSFGSSSCSLSSSSCTVLYTPSSNSAISIVVFASYGGDSTHFGSSGTATLQANVSHETVTSIIPNSVTMVPGQPDTLTTKVADITDSASTPTGTISWSDGASGGSFGSTTCTLSSGTCTVSYTSSQSYKGDVTITSSYGGDSIHTASKTTFLLQQNILDKTATNIYQAASITSQGSQVKFSVKVTDITTSQSIPTGTVSWIDGNAGGSFSPTSCTLSSGTCTVSYNASISSPDKVTITSTYGGDVTHDNSSGTYTLKVNPVHNTSTTITSDHDTITQGSQVHLTIKTVDTSISPITPIGTIYLSDGNGSGTFNPTSCTLTSGTCTVSYNASSISQNLITVNATYNGDSFHNASSGTTQLSEIVLPSSILLNTDQSYYARGDVVTLSVNLPGQIQQNLAVGVSNPSGDNIISRTITTDENGTGSFQFKISDTYPIGAYQGFVSALVSGKNYTNSTEFTVIKSHGISIDSVQIVNQQGKPASMLSKGQNGFVKVSLSSDEKMPVLLTLNLFDANQSSLGTASLKSVANPGSTQVSLSFFISSNTQVGLANVFTDAYSDWPNNGGTPLTAESCLAVDLQDPANLPASYVPTAPHSCTNSTTVALSSGTQFSTMTNNQAAVTLGIEIQNDTMTFMSPTQAHLLALAYKNGTAKTKNNSVGIVNLDMNSLGASINATKIGPDKFTTLAGPDIQNNPLAMKILQEIEASKRQVANILGNETEAKLNQQLVLKQRQAVAGQLKQDLIALQQATSNTTSNAAYAHFLSTLNDDKVKPVFQDEFNFMKQRIDVANTAMQNVLNNGGSLGQALATFNKYATINHVQMVTLNKQLNVAYGLADGRIQSCFNDLGRLVVINGVNSCVADIENNSTGPSGISIISVQATDHQGNPVSLLQRGQTGYVKVVLDSSVSTQSLVTINLFDSDVSSLGTASVQYTLSPGQSEVVLPYFVPGQSATGLASVYANVFTDWPNNGGISQSNELSYFVGLS